MSEFEILKNAHRFLRDDTESDPQHQSWDDKLASKYYASLYREFAVCDLKHYKSGNFALRWRTENEVLSGAGETTCGNTRCEHHHPLPEYLQRSAGPAPPLTTLELPFAYEEHGENKSALVKVVLCNRCVDKLMWKRTKEKGKAVKNKGDADEEETDINASSRAKQVEDRQGKGKKLEEDKGHVHAINKQEEGRRSNRRDDRRHDDRDRRRRSSRSHSPRTKHQRHRSPSSQLRQTEQDHRH